MVLPDEDGELDEEELDCTGSPEKKGRKPKRTAAVSTPIAKGKRGRKRKDAVEPELGALHEDGLAYMSDPERDLFVTSSEGSSASSSSSSGSDSDPPAPVSPRRRRKSRSPAVAPQICKRHQKCHADEQIPMRRPGLRQR